MVIVSSVIAGVAESGMLTDSGMDLTNLYNSSVAWGDIDNDGDFDLAIMGWDGTNRYFQIYKNGANKKLALSQSLTGVSHGCLSFGDYDRDGDLDLAITGRITEAYGITKIYQNDGKGNFSDSGIEIIDVYISALAWGDYNNDGDLDLALVGFRMGTGYTAKIYENKGDGSFEDSGITDLTPVASGSVAWGDYDNDGDLDLALCGEVDLTTYACKIYENNYRNNSNNPFAVKTTLTGVRNSFLAWGDYNNDGWLDIAICGQSTTGYVSEIWKNNGDGTFTKTNDLTGVYNSSLAWGDYDNDGDLDLVVTGLNASEQPTSKIYKNGPGYSFSEDAGQSLIDVDQGSVAWCDYDGDRDIDLALTGSSGSGGVTKIYKNTGSPANTLPDPPDSSKFKTTYNSATQELTIRWLAGSDDETPQDGLYYNFRIGSEPGKDDLVAARYGSPLLGNFISKSTATVDSEQMQTRTFSLYAKGYYWSVQAIDTGLGYSWSEEGTESSWSEEGHYNDESPPPAPETPTDDGEYTYDTTIRFRWTQNNPDPETAIYNYRVQVRSEEDGDIDIKFDGDVGNVKSYSVEGCEYNKTYKARVKAQSGYGYGAWSGWSDGIMVVRLLDISNNLIHPVKAGDKTAAIKYFVINTAKVNLKIYNLMGELVKSLVDNEIRGSGMHEEPWSGENEKGSTVASGIYLVHIEVAGETATEKICVVK